MTTTPPLSVEAQDTIAGVEARTRELMERAARHDGMKISEWVSSRLREAAQRSLDPANRSTANPSGDFVLVPRADAQALLDNLNERIDQGERNGGNVPLFPGIAALNCALSASPAIPQVQQTEDTERLRRWLVDHDIIPTADNIASLGNIFAARQSPKASATPEPAKQVGEERREQIARTVFGVTNPHETWDGFDERFEARGNVYHPMQLQAFEIADAILAALSPQSNDLERMREALAGFVADLTDGGRNRGTCLSVDHDALNARLAQARLALTPSGEQ